MRDLSDHHQRFPLAKSRWGRMIRWMTPTSGIPRSFALVKPRPRKRTSNWPRIPLGLQRTFKVTAQPLYQTNGTEGMLAADADPDVSGGPFAFGPQRVQGRARLHSDLSAFRCSHSHSDLNSHSDLRGFRGSPPICTTCRTGCWPTTRGGSEPTGVEGHPQW